MQFVILEVCVFSCTATVGYSTHPSVTVPGVKAGGLFFPPWWNFDLPGHGSKPILILPGVEFGFHSEAFCPARKGHELVWKSVLAWKWKQCIKLINDVKFLWLRSLSIQIDTHVRLDYNLNHLPLEPFAYWRIIPICWIFFCLGQRTFNKNLVNSQVSPGLLRTEGC